MDKISQHQAGKFKPPTAILLLNMGGPATLDEVQPFLLKLFADREIIPLPFHSQLGPWIARRRTPKVQARYARIGGGSPILRWTRRQGEEMALRLDDLSPHTAPHKAYTAFRYASPSSREALEQMKADGVKRAVSFTLYPQFSCATTGSSLNELWRTIREMGLESAFQWSVIDRWPVHPGFIEATAAAVRAGLEKFPAGERQDVLLMFSAHSLPLSVVERGDPYPQEIGASVHSVMQALNFSHEYLLCYQSSVGPVRWLGPSSKVMIEKLGKMKRKRVLVVPIAFASDHIETLHEIDIEFKELAVQCGIQQFERAPALNDLPIFLNALADIAAAHLARGELCSRQYFLRCPACPNPKCREIINPAVNGL
jgi:protoporphyrin/coproporphyrin ferrochelatase